MRSRTTQGSILASRFQATVPLGRYDSQLPVGTPDAKLYGPRHLFYEDLDIDRVWESPGRLVTADDVATFARLTGDFNPIHTNAEYAATTPFGRPIAHGLLTLSLSSGMSIEHPAVRTIAFMELKSVTFFAPVYPGDVVRTRTTVVSKERRGRGKRGLVTWTRDVLNQDDKIVQRGVSVTLVEAREFPPPLT